MILLETKIGFLGQCPKTGKVKKLKETYLVQKESFADGELFLKKELAPSIDDFTTLSMKRIEVDEIISSEDEEKDKFYLSRVKMIIYDSDSESESKKTVNIIIQGKTLENATKELKTKLGNTMDFTIISIKETKVLDIYLN